MPILPLPLLLSLQLMDQPKKLVKSINLGNLIYIWILVNKRNYVRVVLLQRVMNPPRPCLSLPLMLVVALDQRVNLILPRLVLDRYT